MIQPSAVFSKSMYIVTGKPSETLKNNSTGEPEVTLKNNRAGEPSGKSKDDTGVIAGGITGAILFVIIVVVIVLHVQRKILKNQHDISFKVKYLRPFITYCNCGAFRLQ